LPLGCVDLLILRNIVEEISDFVLVIYFFLFRFFFRSFYRLNWLDCVDLGLLGQKLVFELCSSFCSQKSFVQGVWGPTILCFIRVL